MARSATEDPVERFRFRVSVLGDILASQGGNGAALINLKQLLQASAFGSGETVGSQQETAKIKSQIGASGFSEVTLPKSDTAIITYRENIHATRFIKKPGLTRYEPIILKKGVTSSLDLYNWAKLVNNDAIGYSMTAELVGNALSIPPVYPANFRKNLMITSLDREGNAVKSWVVLDAWPSSYKGGNDLDANSNEKLIAELGLSFEAYVEIPGSSISTLTKMADDAAAQASIAAALGISLSGGKSGGGFL